MTARPGDFAGGLAPPDGGPGWQIDGVLWPENPRLVLPGWVHAVIARWLLCRDVQIVPGVARAVHLGLRHLPGAGGVGQQPAALMQAMQICEAAWSRASGVSDR